MCFYATNDIKINFIDFGPYPSCSFPTITRTVSIDKLSVLHTISGSSSPCWCSCSQYSNYTVDRFRLLFKYNLRWYTVFLNTNTTSFDSYTTLLWVPTTQPTFHKCFWVFWWYPTLRLLVIGWLSGSTLLFWVHFCSVLLWLMPAEFLRVTYGIRASYTAWIVHCYDYCIDILFVQYATPDLCSVTLWLPTDVMIATASYLCIHLLTFQVSSMIHSQCKHIFFIGSDIIHCVLQHISTWHCDILIPVMLFTW